MLCKMKRTDMSIRARDSRKEYFSFLLFLPYFVYDRMNMLEELILKSTKFFTQVMIDKNFVLYFSPFLLLLLTHVFLINYWNGK